MRLTPRGVITASELVKRLPNGPMALRIDYRWHSYVVTSEGFEPST